MKQPLSLKIAKALALIAGASIFLCFQIAIADQLGLVEWMDDDLNSMPARTIYILFAFGFLPCAHSALGCFSRRAHLLRPMEMIHDILQHHRISGYRGFR